MRASSLLRSALRPRTLPVFGLVILFVVLAVGVVVRLTGNTHSTDTGRPRRPSPPAIAAAAPGATASGHHAIKTVFLILMENHNWSSIVGSRSAPYINSLLRGSRDTQTSYATQYYNPPGNHPSLPNYLWLEGGQRFSFCGTDADPNVLIHATHLTTLLTKAGIFWKAYEEGTRNGTCPRFNTGEYAVRHDPFVYFQDVGGKSTVCTAHIESYAALSRDLTRNSEARYNFITPNLCHDMHDTCSPTNDSIRQGDTWLSQQIPLIERSKAYRQGGAIFITWDEGEGEDGPIGMIVLSPLARGHGYHNSIHYTHSSTLRTMEEIFGVRPFLGGAAHAPNLGNLFAKYP